MTTPLRLSAVIAAVVVALSLVLTASASGTPTAAPTAPGATDHPPTTTSLRQPFSSRPPAQAEGVYVAITPCRILDTRKAGGKMANGATRTFHVGGTTQFLPQGGKSGGCGIPTSATAVAASIGATNTAGNGYLTAWPANLPRPTASNLNYTKGQTIASGGNVTVQKNVAASLTIANNGGPTDVFVDVTGYYAQQMQGLISLNGSVYGGSDRITGAKVVSTGTFLVTFDTDVTNCTPMVETFDSFRYGAASTLKGNSVTVDTWYISLTTHQEVSVSANFYLTVTC